MIIQPLDATIQWSYTDLSEEIYFVEKFRCIAEPEMSLPRKVIT
jgi:hypothetical protein